MSQEQSGQHEPAGGAAGQQQPSAAEQAIAADIERTRAELGETVQQLADKAHVGARAKHAATDMRHRAVHAARDLRDRGTHAAAILVEMDYITNKKGAQRLLSKSFRKHLLEGVYAGVLDYVKVEQIGT